MGVNKVLILFAILVISSAASGGIVWFDVEGIAPDPATGYYNVEPNSDIVIFVEASENVYAFITNILGPGTAKDPRYYDPLFSNSFIPYGKIKNNGTQLITDLGLMCPLDFISNVPAGETLYSFTYTTPDTPGQVNITGDGTYCGFIDDWSNVEEINPITLTSATLNITPEPMTIALLGFGGLFLRRRRS